jgi:hypothetical protein
LEAFGLGQLDDLPWSAQLRRRTAASDPGVPADPETTSTANPGNRLTSDSEAA